MTRSISGASPRRHEFSSPPKSPVGRKQPTFDFGTLPPHAPEILAKNTIYVRDPNRILLLKETDCKRDFQTLVNRYTKQLLHGCQEPSCSTPTCFTCRRRVTNAPTRKYTELSARTLAIYLASQDDPEKDLCPHDHVSVVEKRSQERTDFERLGRMIQQQGNSRTTVDEHNLTPEMLAKTAVSYSENLTASVVADDNSSDQIFKAARSTRSENGMSAPVVTDVALNETDNTEGCVEKPTTKDPKSLTQNLFDTLPMKLLSWLPIPSLHSIANFSSERKMSTTTVESARPSPERSASSSTLNNGTPNLEEGSQLPKEEAQAGRVIDDRDPRSPSDGWRPDTSSPRLPESQQISKCQVKDQTTKSRKVRFSKSLMHAFRGHPSLTDDRKGAMFMPTYPDGFSQDLRPPPQSLSHLSFDLVMALIGMMNDSGFYSSGNCMVRSFGKDPDNEWEGRRYNIKYSTTKTFVRQSIFYGLGRTEGLTRSFKVTDSAITGHLQKPSQVIDARNLDHAFRSLVMFDRSLVLHSLWQALEALFVPPPELTWPRSPRLKAALNSVASVPYSTSYNTVASQLAPPKPVHIGDGDAAHIVIVCLHALAAAVPRGFSHEAWHAVRELRAHGQVLPAQALVTASGPLLLQMVHIIDTLEDDLGLRLMSRLVRAVHARGCFIDMLKARNSEETGFSSATKPQAAVTAYIQQHLIHNHKQSDGSASAPQSDSDAKTSSAGWSLPAVTVGWIQSVMLKEWNGKAEVKRSSVVGSAVQMLSHLHEIHEQIGLSPEAFQTPFLSDRLDPVEIPVEWLSSTPATKTLHLLSYPFLFPPAALVGYFRALNHSNMTKAFDTSLTSARLVAQMVFADPFADDSDHRVFNRLKLAVDLFLLLKIRRSHVLKDALDQLWRREKRELMRPLKIQMGMDEGEEGMDIGGVQQEFFRVAIGEASNPDYGIFHTDPTTQISWFQICSFEPLYKFELLGLLVSLAVYNGNTIPLNLPKALYRKLLGLPVTEIQHIRDGWPDKARGFAELLAWNGEEDVGDVFTFSYEFSFDFWDKQINVDMEKHADDDDWMPFQQSTGEVRKTSHLPGLCSDASSSTKNTDDERPQTMEHVKVAKRKGKGKLTAANSVDEADDHVSSSEIHSTKHECSRGLAAVKEFPHLNGEAKTGKASTGNVKPIQQAPQQLPNRTSHGQEEAKLVTNESRERFVRDYIYWLTDRSIRVQYEAFARGFFVCVDKTAISMFNTEALQTVVEGIQDIDINGLERVAKYEDPYDSCQRIIKDFWAVVKEYSLQRKRQLLEFVTSSDRVPANGVGSITFVIMRAGPDSERLPSSTTCFGRLLLPEYASREKLKDKLNTALEHTKGFGNM
ncbi:MAG: hypothetical protein M1836_008206 [Candelina mexicana]|nr:MAG: hypothetical protein M1836_008206 [Candelina mexicana]